MHVGVLCVEGVRGLGSDVSSENHTYTSPEQGQHAQNAQCDVLFITGELDGLAPSEQAEKAYNATKMAPGFR